MELAPSYKNRSYPASVVGYPQEGLYTPTVDQRYRLGTRYQDIDGNVYYYAKAGAVALAAGELAQQAILGGATTTDQVALAVATSSAIGDKFGYATILTTAQTGGLYDDGYYCVEDTTAAVGLGGMYKIKHDDVAKDVASALTVASHKFTFYDPCRTAITAATSIVRLITNPYKGLIQTPVTTVTGACMGGIPMAVTANYYFWLQTYGIFNVAGGASAAISIGTFIQRSVVAGEAISGTASLTTEVIGYALAAITDDTDGPIMLTIRA